MHVFVYGTLSDPERVVEVLGGADGDAAGSAWSFVGDATVHGLHCVDGRYLTLAPGGHVDGRVLRTDAVGALDAYEGVDRGLYVRVRVPVADSAEGLADGAGVAVYVGDPARLDPVEPVTWPGDVDFDVGVRRYVDANDVVVDVH